MSTISITKLYDLLSVKVGRDAAENLTSFIEDKVKNEVEDNLKVLATREDLANIKEDLANIKGELRTEIAGARSDLVKWMFLFWIGQVAATFGFILLFLKK